jgi:signal transduction histidine kinase
LAFRLPGPSLTRRLVLLAAGWSFAVLIAASLLLTAQFRQEFLKRFDEQLAEHVENLLARTEVVYGQVVPPEFTDGRAARAHSGRYWQIARIGPSGEPEVVARSGSLFAGDPNLDFPKEGLNVLGRDPTQTYRYDTEGPAGEPLRVAAKISVLSTPGGNVPLLFVAGEDRRPVDLGARRFAATAATALILLGIGLMTAVFIQVRVGLQPLFDLRREVAEVRKGRRDKLVRNYPAELEPLATELNALVAHNQEVVERQRTHVGNLAHALKTPISVMLAEAQAVPGPLSDVVRRQTEAMHGHVEHHLRRARAAARSQSNREQTMVEPVLDELARTLERIFRDKSVSVDWTCPADLAFQGERQDLLEIVGNVMENACKWSKGRVRVEATALSDTRLSLVIEDDGPGLPASRRAEVLKRGARLDEKTPGSGLGLSIVDELARAYGGDLELGDSPLGGLRVAILLPRAEN